MFKCVLYGHYYSIQGAGLVITSGPFPGLARLGGPPAEGNSHFCQYSCPLTLYPNP